MTARARILAMATLALALHGCQSYRITQRNVFSDEDGFLVSIDYGRSDTDHVNTFISPVTGKEMEFKSRLMIDVELPDGDSFVAWQCMNLTTKGTMYQTDDDEWKVLVIGFTCIVYRQTEEDETLYLEVYRGVVCDTPEIEVEKDDRWRVLPRKDRSFDAAR